MVRRLRVRRGTDADWSTINPILAAGEWGYSTSDKAVKMGDGASTWNSLPKYLNATEVIHNQNASAQASSNAWLSGFLQAGNLRLNGNTLSSQNIDGDIIAAPNGVGIFRISTNVAFGRTTANKRLHIQNTTDDYHLLVQTDSDTIGAWTGIGFRVKNQTADFRTKGAIAYISTASEGRGDLYFLQNSVANSTNVGIGDWVWRMTNAGSFESNGAKTIRTSTGNLTIGTGGANGNILLSPNGVGNTFVNTGELILKSSGTESADYQLNALTMGYNIAGTYGWITAGAAAARTTLVLNGGSSGGNVVIGTTIDNGSKFQVTGTVSVTSSVTANSFIKSGGSSSQFLKADGSLDSSTYLTTSSAASIYEPIFSKNSAFNKNFGTTAGTVAEGNDSRIINGQTAFGWGNHAGLYPLYNGTGASGIWGVSITGNAATVTNGVYTTGSYSNPSWLTSLDYSKLTGAIPTWNQNTTGTASLATNLVNGGGRSTPAAGNQFMIFDSTDAYTFISFRKNGSTVWDVAQNNGGEFEVRHQGGGTIRFRYDSSGFAYADSGYKVVGGSNGQFLKADGSLDSSSYITSAALSGYLLASTATSTYEPIFSKNTAFNKNFGTTSSTVAEGNDSRITNGQTAFGWGNHASVGYLLSSAAASTYEPIFSKNTAFNKNFGTTSGTVAEGNDSRITNGQTAFGWGNHASAGYLTTAVGILENTVNIYSASTTKAYSVNAINTGYVPRSTTIWDLDNSGNSGAKWKIPFVDQNGLLEVNGTSIEYNAGTGLTDILGSKLKGKHHLAVGDYINSPSPNYLLPTPPDGPLVPILLEDGPLNIIGCTDLSTTESATGSRYLYVINSRYSGFNITLKHASGAASANERFFFPSGSDVILVPGEAVMIMYFESNWHLVSSM